MEARKEREFNWSEVNLVIVNKTAHIWTISQCSLSQGNNDVTHQTALSFTVSICRVVKSHALHNIIQI